MGCAAASERRAGAGRADVSSGASGTKQGEPNKWNSQRIVVEVGQLSASSRVRVTASAGRA